MAHIQVKFAIRGTADGLQQIPHGCTRCAATAGRTDLQGTQIDDCVGVVDQSARAIAGKVSSRRVNPSVVSVGAGTIDRIQLANEIRQRLRN